MEIEIKNSNANVNSNLNANSIDTAGKIVVNSGDGIGNLVGNNIIRNNPVIARGISNEKMDIVFNNKEEMPNIKVTKIDEAERQSNFNNNNADVVGVNNVIPVTSKLVKNINILNINSNYANITSHNQNSINMPINNKFVKELKPDVNLTNYINSNNNQTNSAGKNFNNNHFTNYHNQTSNNILFFIEDLTIPKQKIKRKKIDEEMTFPHEFQIDS
jgi:hypothetical protein